MTHVVSQMMHGMGTKLWGEERMRKYSRQRNQL